MEKKQTAVKWIIEQINLDQYQNAFGQTYISIELVEQALQMEKEQIENAVKYGCSNWGSYKDEEQYYTETYGKETDRS